MNNVVMNSLKLSSSFIRNIFAKKKTDFGKYSVVKVGKVSPKRNIPDHICKPSYYKTGKPIEDVELLEIKNSEQIKTMRASCKLAANILKFIENNIRVGQTTDDIDKLVHNKCIENGAYPSPFDYKHFPKSVCTSVNNVACHGIPDDRPLQNGDIINVDITVFYNGYHGDCSRTFLVGDVDDLGRELVKANETCLMEAIRICRPGRFFRDIGKYIEERANQLGFNVIPAFVGHGIGHYFHGPPEIYHTENSYPGRMEAGMTFTIEPVLTQGGQTIVILEDEWTAVTEDNARTAQCEHTILVTPNGAEILTTPD